LANIINGTDTGSGGLITTGDSSDELQLQTAEVARVTLTNTAVVVNESGADVDFRVEGDTDANLLFVDASADRVGIGTSSPASKLNVSSTAGATVSISNTSTSLVTDDGMGTLDFTAGTSNTTNARVSGLVVGTSEAGGSLAFETRADGGSLAERARITSDGYLRMASGSGGIQFNGDTLAANALDDYEEGTFTITFTPTTSGTATANASYNTMSYTKIGNMVTIFGNPRVSSVGSPVGELYLNGLPFAVASTTNISRGGVSITYLVLGTGYKAVPILAIETTTYLFIFTSSVGHTVAAGDEMLISFSYRTT
jgi:hypothetical protein